MIDWLVELIQEVWKTRQVLQEWKNVTLVPLHEKKDQKECKNYRGISLLSIEGKVLALVLLERMRIVIEPQLSEAQRGFRKGRGTVDQIWVTRQVMEKAVEYRTPVHLCFIDLTKAYDSVDRSAMVAILRLYGVPHQLVEIIEDLYVGTWCHVRTTDRTSQDFEVKTGVRQGCVLYITHPIQLCHGQNPEGGSRDPWWRCSMLLLEACSSPTAIRPNLQHSSKMYCMPMT